MADFQNLQRIAGRTNALLGSLVLARLGNEIVDGDEGQTWIGSDLFQEADYAAGMPKHFGIAAFFADPAPALVATATDADGNTSEFGPAALVPEAGAAPVAAAAALAGLTWRRARRRPT